MREQRVALEDVADAPPLGRHVDAGHRVEEHVAVHHDAAGIRAHEPGQALQREGLPGARRPEERHDTVARGPLGVEREAVQRLPD